MRLNPQAIINSRLGVGLALSMARGFPPSAGYRIARLAADVVASQKSWGLVQAVRANQWIVNGGDLTEAELNQEVQMTFRNTAHCIYDLYHYIHNQTQLLDMIAFDSASLEIIQRSKMKESGLIIVGVHSSGFDVVMQGASLRGLEALVITLPQLNPGYQWQTEMRERVGMEIQPASVATLHEAVRRLRNGGVVLTGLDRPIEGLKHRPRFFGREASLPVHYIQLALKAEVPVRVATALLCPDGSYRFLISDAIDMLPYPDRDKEIVGNAERALKVAEGMICRAPSQWAMFYPVWETTLEELGR
jgi:lauroyl/myristoyl acyltransferase